LQLCSKISPAGASDHSIQSKMPNSSGLSGNALSVTAFSSSLDSELKDGRQFPASRFVQIYP